MREEHLSFYEAGITLIQNQRKTLQEKKLQTNTPHKHTHEQPNQILASSTL